MGWEQLVTPDPDIPCWPGMCLQYVRQAFGAPLVEPTAAAGWQAAQYRHEDMDFPEGIWLPLWFAIPGIPAGHVALRAPDGSVYSTSDNSTVPHHHPSLDHLIWYYGPRVQPQYQLELQYLGWSEDISTVRIAESTDIMNDYQQGLLQEMHDRIMGRDVQRWFNPDTMEVRLERFDGSIPARSADLHDVMSTNNWIAQNIQRVLEAVAATPGVDSALVSRLSTELSQILTDATKNLTVTLTTK